MVGSVFDLLLQRHKHVLYNLHCNIGDFRDFYKFVLFDAFEFVLFVHNMQCKK